MPKKANQQLVAMRQACLIKLPTLYQIMLLLWPPPVLNNFLPQASFDPKGGSHSTEKVEAVTCAQSPLLFFSLIILRQIGDKFVFFCALFHKTLFDKHWGRGDRGRRGGRNVIIIIVHPLVAIYLRSSRADRLIRPKVNSDCTDQVSPSVSKRKATFLCK